jgi:hypothetical protein
MAESLTWTDAAPCCLQVPKRACDMRGGCYKYLACTCALVLQALLLRLRWSDCPSCAAITVNRSRDAHHISLCVLAPSCLQAAAADVRPHPSVTAVAIMQNNILI